MCVCVVCVCVYVVVVVVVCVCVCVCAVVGCEEEEDGSFLCACERTTLSQNGSLSHTYKHLLQTFHFSVSWEHF